MVLRFKNHHFTPYHWQRSWHGSDTPGDRSYRAVWRAQGARRCPVFSKRPSGGQAGRLREIVGDYGRSWEILVCITWYVLIAERGECVPEMLPRIGIVPSRRNGRKRWSEARLLGQRFLTFGLFCSCGPDHRLRPFRRIGKIPIRGSISGKHSPRSAIKKYMVDRPLMNYHISRDLRSVS